MIENLIKGDSIIFECKAGEDVTGWEIRAELWDEGSVDIKNATANISGGSTDQIEITDATGGVFLVKIQAGDTTNIEAQANLEIEIETTEGRVYTIFQSIVKFTSEKITWSTP